MHWEAAGIIKSIAENVAADLSPVMKISRRELLSCVKLLSPCRLQHGYSQTLIQRLTTLNGNHNYFKVLLQQNVVESCVFCKILISPGNLTSAQAAT